MCHILAQYLASHPKLYRPKTTNRNGSSVQQTQQEDR